MHRLLFVCALGSAACVGETADDPLQTSSDSGTSPTSVSSNGAGGSSTGAGGSSNTSAGPGGATSSSTANSSSSSGTGGGPGCMNDTTMHTGQATWYVLNTPLVNCSYETQALPQFYGAMNTAEYASSAVCGACVEVHAPNTNQTVTIEIVDQCPVSTNPICTSGHIDLNQAAFQQLDNLVTGVIPITWQYVPCNLQGNVVYRFKEGSSQYWTALQIRNHRYAIKKVEYKMVNDPYTELVRQDYNYFLDANGMGPGPYTLRVTDIHDQVIVDNNIPLNVAQLIQGSAQFPPCSN